MSFRALILTLVLLLCCVVSVGAHGHFFLGPPNFLELIDGPEEGSYDGQAGKGLAVNSSELGLEYTNLVSPSLMDDHINSSAIHFFELAIDHRNIFSVGTKTHTDIDGHIDFLGIHFLEDIHTHPWLSVGDILVYSSTTNFGVRLPVGPNDFLLTADAVKGEGLKWAWKVLDDDTMASDSAIRLATQQSIVAYIAASISTPGGANTNVQINSNGAFYGDSGFTYTPSTGIVSHGDNDITNVGAIELDIIRADTADGDIFIELDNAVGADLHIGNNNTILVEGDRERVSIGGDASPDGQLGIKATTATERGLVIRSTDNNATNPVFETQSSGGTTHVTMDFRGKLDIDVLAQSGTAENLFEFSVNDASSTFGALNASSTDGIFLPAFNAVNNDDNRYALSFRSFTNDTQAAGRWFPGIFFRTAKLDNSALTAQPSFGLRNADPYIFGIWFDGKTKIGGSDVGATGMTTPNGMLEVITASSTVPGLYIKGSAGQTGALGVFTDNSDNRLVEIEPDGGVVFAGTGAGLAFAEIYAQNVGEDVVIGTLGVANKVQVTAFDTDGESNNMTPDHTNDHITVTKAGMYYCSISCHVDSQSGSAATFGFALYKNNGVTQFANVHGHIDMPAGAGGNSRALSMAGIVDLAATDTMELWAWNEDNTQDITVDDVTMSLFQLGGT